MIKYNEELTSWDTMTDEEFLSAAEGWLAKAGLAAEQGHNLVFVGRGGISRLLAIARNSEALR